MFSKDTLKEGINISSGKRATNVASFSQVTSRRLPTICIYVEVVDGGVSIFF
jgi:hypothetical protein